MYIENMSGNIVERGYSVYLNGQVQGALSLANQGISDASSAQADATQALADASNAQSSADTADDKAVAVDTKTDKLNFTRNMDMEALLQELVVDVTAPDGAFILGDDSGYYAWDTSNSEYRVTSYASGEALDDSDAVSNATQFELIAKGSNGLYMLLEDDGGSLFVVNHSTGTREALDDVIDGTDNDRSTASSDGFESAKSPFDYMVRYCYAPINLSHHQNGNDIYSVHLRAIDGDGEPKLWLYKDTDDKLVSSAMSNVQERRMYVHEIS